MTTLNAGWLNVGNSVGLPSLRMKRSPWFAKPKRKRTRRSAPAVPTNHAKHAYKFPIEQAVTAILVAAPVGLLAWGAIMWILAGWLAAFALTAPLLLAAAPVAFVLRKVYAKTNLRNSCLAQLERRPTNIDYESRRLDVYPYPYIKTARHRDENGIIEIRLAGGVKIQATVTIAQYALCIFGKFLHNQDPALREDFLRHADALLDTQQIGGDRNGAWVQKHVQEYYAPHDSDYLSSMAQSQAISVLLRAYQLTDNKSYLEAAERAMKPFEKTVAQGGVRTEYPDGKVFFEEYCLRPFYSHTLNGFIYTLFGLEEMARATGHERARHWYERGVETLARPGVLAVYDLGYISAYDQLNRKLPALDYHRTHISQLASLYDITGRIIFQQTAERWLRYTEQARARFRLTVHLLANKMLTGVTAMRNGASPAKVYADSLIPDTEQDQPRSMPIYGPLPATA